MINDRLVHLQAIRIYLINFCFCSPCNWDLAKKRMKASEPFHFWNWWLLLGGVVVYILSVFYRIYKNGVAVFGNDSTGTDQEKVYIVSQTGKQILASMIHLTIDVLAAVYIVNMIGIAIMLSERRHLLWKANNAVVDLNTSMMQILETHNGYRPTGQNASGRRAERILVLLNVCTLVVPILYGVFLLHPFEPVHRTLEEWLEIKPKLNLPFLPLMLMVDWGLIFCGNIIYLPLCMGLLYIELCQFWIPGISPQSTILFQGKTHYSTELGLIDGQVIMKLYRCQQVINVVINEIMKSGWASLHHATVLVAFVFGTFICIQYTDEVKEMGIMGIILPAVAVSAMLIEYFETHLLGKILWESREFIRIGKKVGGHDPLLRKFFLSCTDIKLKTAYPFFDVSFDTFLLVLNQGIDFLVSMLVFAG